MPARPAKFIRYRLTQRSRELWNPPSKTVCGKCSFISNKGPVIIWNDHRTQKQIVRRTCKCFSWFLILHYWYWFQSSREFGSVLPFSEHIDNWRLFNYSMSIFSAFVTVKGTLKHFAVCQIISLCYHFKNACVLSFSVRLKARYRFIFLNDIGNSMLIFL